MSNGVDTFLELEVSNKVVSASYKAAMSFSESNTDRETLKNPSGGGSFTGGGYGCRMAIPTSTD